MIKPQKPQNKFEIKNSTTFYFDHVSNKVSLNYFIDWCKKQIPKQAKDITLSLETEYYYDDSETHLVLNWKEFVENKSYKKQMKSYKKKLLKWKEQNKCQ